MNEPKRMNRWLVVLGALLIQVSLGAIYIYSVFKPGLAQRFPDWTPTDLALPSQLVLALFALSMILAGRVQDRLGPRPIAIIGGVLLGLGLVVASRATSLAVFVIGFSVIGGLGIGAAYVCPIATCVKWFPDKRGLITGLAVAGFGAGGLVFTPIAKYLIVSRGVMSTFFWLGLIFLVAVILGGLLMVNPPAGYKPLGWTPPESGLGVAVHRDYTWQGMLKTPQFWLLWLTYFAGCTAGLMVIMNITNIWQSFSMLGLVSDRPTVSHQRYQEILVMGATAVITVSVLNALGRIAWGKISDSLGRKPALIIMFVLSGILMLAQNQFRTFDLFLGGVALIGFCFGGFLALFPAVTADYFGTRNIGANYGWVFSAYGAGGLFGPWLAPKLMTVVRTIPYMAAEPSGCLVHREYSAGDYSTAFIISGLMCLASATLVLLLKPPSAPTP